VTIVVDSTVLVDNLRERPDATARVVEALEQGERLSASTLTKVELLAGMRSSERHRTRRLLDSLDWISVSDPIAERAGALARRYRASHTGVGVVDFVIAATVEELEAELWTRNVKHFPMFAGLKPPY
jgi:predicted nucleic acid-binding protein